MIKIEQVDVYGWEAAIRGMRNPMNSWDKSDSNWNCVGRTKDDVCWGECDECEFLGYELGKNDLKLMQTLSKAGSDHGKFLRMITVTLDITAPLYWWKEFDTYKVGTVANSCSTMHKIHAKEFELEDFSHEHLIDESVDILRDVIDALNDCRDVYVNYDKYLEEGKLLQDVGKKLAWWQMIQLLPSSYNQKRTVQLNYQVLKSMYHARKAHKLDCWVDFCDWMLTLPYFKELCVDVGEDS